METFGTTWVVTIPIIVRATADPKSSEARWKRYTWTRLTAEQPGRTVPAYPEYDIERIDAPFHKS